MYFDELLKNFSQHVHHAYFMRTQISLETLTNYNHTEEAGHILVETPQGIDEMRQLVQKLSLRHQIPSLYIISPTAWSVDIQNTLLKTLEEPAHNVYLIVHAQSPSFSFLPTINSRAQEIFLKKEGREGDTEIQSTAVSFLKKNTEQRLARIEKITREDLMQLINELEEYIGKEIIEKKDAHRIVAYNEIQRLGIQAQHSSSMTKMLAEYLALLDL